jgi:hypothetical protein
MLGVEGPAPQAKHVLIELVGKALRPGQELRRHVRGEDFMERIAITIGLIAGHLVDQGDDTHPGERPDQDFDALRDVALAFLQRPPLPGFQDRVAQIGQDGGLVAVGEPPGAWRAKEDGLQNASG